jgi:hypothetical protein
MRCYDPCHNVAGTTHGGSDGREDCGDGAHLAESLTHSCAAAVAAGARGEVLRGHDGGARSKGIHNQREPKNRVSRNRTQPSTTDTHTHCTSTGKHVGSHARRVAATSIGCSRLSRVRDDASKQKHTGTTKHATRHSNNYLWLKLRESMSVGHDAGSEAFKLFACRVSGFRGSEMERTRERGRARWRTYSAHPHLRGPSGARAWSGARGSHPPPWPK